MKTNGQLDFKADGPNSWTQTWQNETTIDVSGTGGAMIKINANTKVGIYSLGKNLYNISASKPVTIGWETDIPYTKGSFTYMRLEFNAANESARALETDLSDSIVRTLLTNGYERPSK
jgi:hypothetical protein